MKPYLRHTGRGLFAHAYKFTTELAKLKVATQIGMTSRGTSPSGLSLIFQPGHRPSADAVARLLSPGEGVADLVFPCAMGPARTVEGQAEIIAAGLSFELSGLAPAPAMALPHVQQWLGFETPMNLDAMPAETLTLAVGPHLSGGANMLPVVRAMCGVGTALARLPGLIAMAWVPAATGMTPAHFTRVITTWLEGGAFPALGLTALLPAGDTALASHGLAFFTGQELRIELNQLLTKRNAGKIAIRLIHSLVESQPVSQPQRFAGPDGELLHAEPLDKGRIVRIWSEG